MAFSHAITTRGGALSARRAMPSAIAGATKRRMLGPTAVVTTVAREISSNNASASAPLSMPETPETSWSRAPGPTSSTRYAPAALMLAMSSLATSAKTSRKPASWSSSPTKPRPMLPAPKWTAVPVVTR